MLMTTVFHKVLNLNMKKFFFNCHIKMFGALLGTAVAGIALFWIIPQSGWIIFLCKCGIVAIIYVLLMWITAWDKSEKELVLGTLKSMQRTIKRESNRG